MVGARARSVVLLVATFGAAALAAGSASARPQDPDRKAVGAGPTQLEQAREESGLRDRPRMRYELPGGVLRLSAAELLAASAQTLELSVTLDREVAEGTLQLTLPREWIARSGVSGLPFARVPASGRGAGTRAAARRSDRVVTFDFAAARSGDAASFELKDRGIPAGTYRLPYRWRERNGTSASGSITAVFYAPTREGPESGEPGWLRLPSPRFEQNATDDVVTNSETFVSVVPGDRKRSIVGANDASGGGYNAWITNDGGQTFAKAPLPALTDVPGEAGAETSNLCCDPMSTADGDGNLWYGGLSLANGAGQPSRIVVNRVAPGETSFQPLTVGLPVRTGGTQDKPMMTIDNAPASPRFGRLYVVWNEPAGGAINIVISQCDTRPGGVLNAANCDNADNWTAPVNVTTTSGSFIYADVAASPDGTVNVVWWDFSAANAIRGDTCEPPANCASAAAWGTPQTIATLEATGGPIPFECPIEAQPGGRASTSPQVDVDRSGGTHHGRVYVTWSDLRTGSGSTRCADGLPPAATHLTWDSFVASAVGTLPGGTGPSPDVATRLLTDGEGGGQANSDDWFAWLAVDQTTGQAWADFYSTRDDATRNTTNFYVRTVTPNGPSHTLGALTKVSGQPSNYSNNPCCQFGNDYGDYTGIDATQGVAYPVWSDKRDAADGEAFTVIGVGAGLVTDPATVVDDADADGVLEPGEQFRLTQPLRNAGNAKAENVKATLTETLPELSIAQPESDYPEIAAGAVQSNATPYAGALAAEAGCGQPVAMKLQARSADGKVTLPVSVPTGVQKAPMQFSAAPDLAIPDDDRIGVTAEQIVDAPGLVVGDVDVRLNITHTYDNDLAVWLRAPDLTTVQLVLHRGGSGANFTDTVLDDEADAAIAAGSPPFTGSFRPETPLSALDGKPAHGTWRLTVVDDARIDTGTLASWRLSIRPPASCSSPPAAPSLTSTDPPSPAAGTTTPLVTGTAVGGATVRLYTGATCTGPPAVTGTAAALASPGLPVAVPAGQTTQIRGTVTLANFTSRCSPAITFVHGTVAPPPPPPPPAPPPPPPLAPPPPPPPLAFLLTGKATQKPLGNDVGLVVRLSCPSENCSVAVTGSVTIPAPKAGGRANKVRLKRSNVSVTKGRPAKLTLTLSKRLRSRISRALRSARTRTRVKAAISATATGAGGRKTTRTLNVKLRR
jgi:subtilisin-like proprotein convertase family protein